MAENSINSIPICIVDDNEDDRYLLKRMLKKLKISSQIFEVANGQEALDFLTNEKENKEKFGDDYPPAIIFLDINMPIMSGHEFVKAYQDIWNETQRSVVIMTYSSSESEEDRKEMFKFPFVKDYLIKGSFTVDDLSEKIKAQIS